MPVICYEPKNFAASTKTIIDHAAIIIAEYAAQGFDLTLRQLYYQFVARDLLANQQKEYKRLGEIISNARLAGLIDWNAITDRTRNVSQSSHWSGPADIIASAAASFALDKWKGQPFRIEVWIEKDALIGVLDAVCPDLDVPYFSCRGYVSQSEMWAAAQRLNAWAKKGQRTKIIHLGDHDPSGIDMSRDIRDRLRTFKCLADVERIALTMAQVEEYNPPPNPAKDTDARFTDYQEAYGDECWELDALDPATLTQLIRDAVEAVRDDTLWDAAQAQEAEGRELLERVSSQWNELITHLDEEEDD